MSKHEHTLKSIAETDATKFANENVDHPVLYLFGAIQLLATVVIRQADEITILKKAPNDPKNALTEADVKKIIYARETELAKQKVVDAAKA